MTAIQVAKIIVFDGRGAALAAGLAEERCVRTAEACAALPAGTITIDADECCAVAVGDGTFQDIGLAGSYPAAESVVLPAYIIAGPGLPVLIPGEHTVLASQAAAGANRFEFNAVDASGTLLAWHEEGDFSDSYVWEAAGKTEPATPVFPVTAWC
ncbi:MAG TPA: hypothetical protein VF867_14110 [Arthrobacter sp.]